MSADCPACRDAQTRPTHLYLEGCVTCDVRRISNEPQHRRLQHYATIRDLKEREAFQTAVAFEYRRRKGFTP